MRKPNVRRASAAIDDQRSTWPKDSGAAPVQASAASVTNCRHAAKRRRSFGPRRAAQRGARAAASSNRFMQRLRLAHQHEISVMSRDRDERNSSSPSRNGSGGMPLGASIRYATYSRSTAGTRALQRASRVVTKMADSERDGQHDPDVECQQAGMARPGRPKQVGTVRGKPDVKVFAGSRCEEKDRGREKTFVRSAL